MSEELEPKKVDESRVEMTEIVMPNDANPFGNLMGGRVMHWIDIAAAIAAGRHAERLCVTASVDRIDWLNPVRIGHVVVLKASVNYAHRTSMECGVKVWSEERQSGRRTPVASAYLTFVALDRATGRPVRVPQIVPESDEDKRRYRNAQERRKRRLEQRERDKHERGDRSCE